MQHPTKHIIKQSLTLAAKWRSHKASWARVVTTTSTLHVLFFYATLIRTMYTLKYTISCSSFDYRYSIYVIFLNLVALFPICPAAQRDEEGRRQNVALEEPLIMCSTTNVVTSFLAVPATCICFWFKLLSPIDFVILLAGHGFAVTAVFVHRCYAKCSTIAESVAQSTPVEDEDKQNEENAEEEGVKTIELPVLSTLKPIRKKWFRIGYLFRVLFLVLTYFAYINLPSTEHSCPVHPAATYLSYTASVTLLLTIMNELADDDCKFISVYRNVLDRRQYIAFGFHRYVYSVTNYRFHMASALTFACVGLILFMFNFLTVADFLVAASGSTAWMILHTLSCVCFTKFFNQVVEDHIQKYIAEKRAVEAAQAEQGQVNDEVKEDADKKEEDRSLLV